MELNKPERERPRLSFQVITDTHVTVDPDHEYNRNFDRALKDIAANAVRSGGIMHVGDLTDHGDPEEYREMNRILAANREGLPDVYFTLGNHDVALGDWNSRLANYIGHSGMAGPYHDHWIGGYHFIFIGTERGLERFCDLSQAQLNWLDLKLGERASMDKPVFVFLHQPLKDTVAGSLEAQNWYGVVQDAELKRILGRHPQAILFTGHTHWHLGAERTMVEGRGSMATLFNAASVAYLWTDEDEPLLGSQGYYVEVYADRVLVKGRDFTAGRWVESAQFSIPIPS
ncbi:MULTISPECIES: metallophosphoesterase family protein [Paenibacillus]|uniref:metallophosphoesterase family protein n=1 Tax=Paenibacillus TaxID=44249 RepID=UPI002FE242C8